jgi:hypothetical protein
MGVRERAPVAVGSDQRQIGQLVLGLQRRRQTPAHAIRHAGAGTRARLRVPVRRLGFDAAQAAVVVRARPSLVDDAGHGAQGELVAGCANLERCRTGRARRRYSTSCMRLTSFRPAPCRRRRRDPHRQCKSFHRRRGIRRRPRFPQACLCDRAESARRTGWRLARPAQR